MQELLFFDPYFKTVLWGGDWMKRHYDYPIPNDKTGEAWVISSNTHGRSTVRGGSYDAIPLDVLWENHRELFGNLKNDRFPLLVKVIDANAHLSIQVHPSDAYAKEYEGGDLGKTECWYVLDCEEDADIIIGHHAKNVEELSEAIDKGQWDTLLTRFPINKGDFFYIPSGTIHAIRKGTQVLEVQENSDLTYRLYDYDRLDHGKKRDLHIEKSIAVTNCPDLLMKTTQAPKIFSRYTTQVLVNAPYFTVSKWTITSKMDIELTGPFAIVVVIVGSGWVDGRPIIAGDAFIVPNQYGKITLSGQLELIVSEV